MDGADSEMRARTIASRTRKWPLPDTDLPRHWLNPAALLRSEFPLPRRRETDESATFSDLAATFSDECCRIELLEGNYGTDLEIAIPDAVVNEYLQYRPTPLVRARSLEAALNFSGRIYYKREDLNPAGSHKPNTAIPQAYYAKTQGLGGLITDTGAGQWGVALGMACRKFGLDCTVFMTRNSYDEKPYRRFMMELAGAAVHSSPSALTEQGRTLLQQDPQHRGSLGIGMGEAMDLVRRSQDRRLALGCMSYYAALHQTIVGQELTLQLRAADCAPAALVACVGGGTNLFGFMAPFLVDRLQGAPAPRMVAAESSNVPALTEGTYRYDFADSFGLTHRVLMYTLGHEFVPPRLHAGGLRYHGKSPILSLMVRKGFVEPVAIDQARAFDAARLFFETEGVLAAPESGHAIAAVLDEISKAKSEGKARDIVFCLSGTGYLDLAGYAGQFNLS